MTQRQRADVVAALLALALLAAPRPAHAQQPYGPIPGFETHDGAYVRLQVGPDWTHLRVSQGVDAITVQGGGALVSVAVGGAVARNLIVYGEFFDNVATNPSADIAGLGSGTLDGDSNIVGIGPGIAYYLEPLNLYVAGTVALAQVELDDGNGNAANTSRWGLAAEATIGKEWWVSPNWGLGVAWQVVAGTMKYGHSLDVSGGDPSWKVFGTALAFSATFN